MPKIHYTPSDPNLDNYRPAIKEGDITLDETATLKEFITLWLELFKKNSIKPASYNRLLVSLNSLDNYYISTMPIGKIGFFDVQAYVNQLVTDGYG